MKKLDSFEKTVCLVCLAFLVIAGYQIAAGSAKARASAASQVEAVGPGLVGALEAAR